jgi:hypothetical protein
VTQEGHQGTPPVPQSPLLRYIAACDERRGRPSDPDRVARIAAALEPLLALGERLGPWPDTVPAGLVEADRE